MKVGKDAIPCVVHRPLLCSHSKYFANAFNGNFTEARDREITLTNVEHQTFITFMNWLYYSKFDFDLEPATDTTNDDKESHLKSMCDSLLDMYIFGDTYDCPLLRRAVLLHWQEAELIQLELQSRTMVYRAAIEKAFENLPATSPLCQAIASSLSSCVLWNNFKADDLPASFWFSISKTFQLTMFKHVEGKNQVNDAEVFKRHRQACLDSICEHHEHLNEQDASDCPVAKKATALKARFQLKK